MEFLAIFGQSEADGQPVFFADVPRFVLPI